MLHPFGTRPLLRSLPLALAACVALAAPALAGHEPPRLGLTPIGESGQYFDLILEPGESRQLQVELANFGHDELLARTFAADAYTIINGGFAAELFGEPAAGTTRWLDYPTRELTLGPGDGVTVDFHVSVPAATPPGEYITALVAENAVPYSPPDQGGVALAQVNRTVVAVAIDVPGPRLPALEIGAIGHKLAAGMSFVTFEVANTGNVHLKPAGSFSLRDADGVQIASAEPGMDSVYAGTATLLEVPLAEVLAPGEYCAEVSLADAKTGVSAATECLAFTVAAPVVEDGTGSGSQTIPILQPAVDAVGDNPLLAGALLIAPVVIAGGAVFIRRRRRRVPTSGPPHRESPTGARAAWPTAEPLPDEGADRTLPAELHLLPVLRDQLTCVPAVERAWLVERDDVTVLAIEGAAGTMPADGARIVRELQAVADAQAIGRPLRVAYVQGPGPVARATGAAMPFYRRAAHQGQFGA